MSRPVRGFLGFLLVALAALALAAIAIVPIVVQPLVVDAVRAALPFASQSVEVEADVSAIGLLRGRIDRIEVRGTTLEVERADVSTDPIRIGSLDLTAMDVSIAERTPGAVTGGLAGVVVPAPDGLSITVDRVDVGGGSPVDATLRLGPADGAELVAGAFADAGVPVDGISLLDGGVLVGLLGQQVGVGLSVADGALVVVGVLDGRQLPILQPAAGSPWQIVGVSVSTSGLELRAVVDVGGVLAPRD